MSIMKKKVIFGNKYVERIVLLGLTNYGWQLLASVQKCETSILMQASMTVLDSNRM